MTEFPAHPVRRGLRAGASAPAVRSLVPHSVRSETHAPAALSAHIGIVGRGFRCPISLGERVYPWAFGRSLGGVGVGGCRR